MELSALPAPTASPSLTVLSSAAPVPLNGTIVFPDPPSSAGTKLRRISEQGQYTLYWLDEPADPLEENEDATTEVM